MEKYTKYFLPISAFILTIGLFYFLGKDGLNTNNVVGIIMVVVGYGSWLAGRIYLGKAYSLLPEAKFLVTTGVYSKVRHPLYVSQLLTLAGVIVYVQNSNLWYIFVVILLIQMYRKKKEEKLLLEKFGDEYKEYMESTWF